MSRVNVSIVGSHTVKPAGVQAHEGPLHMTAWDQVFSDRHIKTILMYNPTSQDWIESLKGSLGLALAQFSPFAGRLRWVDERHRELEILCNGEGAQLVEAECDGEMSWFRGYTDPENVLLLLPTVDHERPLEEVPTLLVQLTRFRCGGVALGLSTAHMAADGQATFHFFTEWARLSRGELMKDAPSLLYRTIFPERERRRELNLSDHTEFEDLPLMLRRQEEDRTEKLNTETVKLALPLTKAQLDALKKAASSNLCNQPDSASRSFSHFEVVTSHIWRCVSKARGNLYEQQTILAFPVNVRNHIHTIPLPEASFGNMVIMMRAKSKSGELIASHLGFACEKIREAINRVDEDYIWSNFEILEKQDDSSFFSKGISSAASKAPKEGKCFCGNPNLKVTSWLSLPINCLDFGWGDKIDIIPVVRDIDGTVILLPNPNNNGSIVVLLCLQAPHVNEFKKYFYQDINMD